MSEAAPAIAVVAAVIVRHGRYLLGRRPEHKRHGGLWEFPGGKVGADESLAEAAARELDEELSVACAGVGAHLWSSGDPGSPYRIEFVEVRIDGEPRALEHTEVGWFTTGELREMPLAPTDRAFVERLARSS
ncbi:MAG: NUDIX domain-containing protein [Longimicrobiales bacterium]